LIKKHSSESPLLELKESRELMPLYRKFREVLGRDSFTEAKNKKDTLGDTHLVEILDSTNKLSYNESALLIFEVYKDYFSELIVGDVHSIRVENSKIYFVEKDEEGNDEYMTEVSVCIIPSSLEKKVQMILPFPDYEKVLDAQKVRETDIPSSPPKSDNIKTLHTHTFEEVVKQAIKKNTSDIHINYMENKKGVEYNIYFRIDGLSRIQPLLKMNKEQGRSLVDEIMRKAAPSSKGGFSPNRRNLLQDARVLYPSLKAEVRLAFFPDGQSEELKVVARIALKKHIVQGEFDPDGKLGYQSRFKEVTEAARTQSNGLFLSSGVTGSGKTTLMGHQLAALPDTWQVYSFEDPIENTLSIPHITQIQIFDPPTETGEPHKDRIDWARLARAAKRGDPDGVFFGELRKEKDGSLGDAVVELAESGQTIFGTIHTRNSFSSYVTLDRSFKMDYYAMVDILLFATNQVLVRRLCPACKEEDLENENLMILKDKYNKRQVNHKHTVGLKEFIDDEGVITYKKGSNFLSCLHCNGEGYIDRIPVYDWLMPNVELKDWLAEERRTQFQVEEKVYELDIGENKLDCYLELLRKGVVDTSPEIIRSVI